MTEDDTPQLAAGYLIELKLVRPGYLPRPLDRQDPAQVLR